MQDTPCLRYGAHMNCNDCGCGFVLGKGRGGGHAPPRPEVGFLGDHAVFRLKGIQVPQGSPFLPRKGQVLIFYRCNRVMSNIEVNGTTVKGNAGSFIVDILADVVSVSALCCLISHCQSFGHTKIAGRSRAWRQQQQDLPARGRPWLHLIRVVQGLALENKLHPGRIAMVLTGGICPVNGPEIPSTAPLEEADARLALWTISVQPLFQIGLCADVFVTSVCQRGFV